MTSPSPQFCQKYISVCFGFAVSRYCKFTTFRDTLNERNAVWQVTRSSKLNIFLEIKLGLAHRESMSVIKPYMP